MNLDAHTRIAHAYLARFLDKDLETIRAARKQCSQAQMHLSTWSQAKAHTAHVDAIKAAVENLYQHDIDLIESTIAEAGK